MSSPAVAFSAAPPIQSKRTDTILLLVIAAAFALLHILTNGRYGFHRDELQFLYDAKHLDWGFVAYPPFTPFVEHISMSLFGLSLIGLRLFSVLAQATVVFLSGLMARDLGGGRMAQVFAAFAVALSAPSTATATQFQYTSFDLFWWVLTAYFVIRLLKSDNPRWWLAIGAVLGLGLQTKYAIVFYIAGIVAGVLFTRARKHLAGAWFWSGVAIALLIFLPNLLWLIRHDFVSYRFLQHIHARDVGEGRAEGFLRDQFLFNVNLFAVPVWIAGLIAVLRSPRYRMLAFMFLVPIAIFYFAKGRFYYTMGVYPMMVAIGAATCERWLQARPKWARIAIPAIAFTGVAVLGAWIQTMLVPLAASGPLRNYALQHSEDLREEIGWNEMVSKVAAIRDSLTPDQQAHLGIAVGNYGEAGAIEIFGPAYHLPAPISTTNTGWLVGYPTPPPTTIIVLGNSPERVNEILTGCRLVAHNANSEGVKNEESTYHPDIFLCGPPKQPWAEFWKANQNFG